MTPIERLRSKSPYLHGSSAERTMDEAADEIERLNTLQVATAARAESSQNCLRAEARELRANLKQAESNAMTREPPICIGKPIIQTLAQEGAWQSARGNGLVAADELYRNDPYAEIERLRAAMVSADNLYRDHRQYEAILAIRRAIKDTTT